MAEIAMKEARFFLLVRFWVAPQAKARLMRWLEGGHVAEVLAQPGFLWCRRISIAETDSSGWSAHAMIYGIDSREAYDSYAANTALHEKFNREREPFAKQLRIERAAGEVDFALG
jgi:hypothetical protein